MTFLFSWLDQYVTPSDNNLFYCPNAKHEGCKINISIVERYILKEFSKFCALPWMNDLDSPIITVDCGAHG